MTDNEELMLMCLIFLNQSGNIAGTLNHMLRTDDDKEKEAYKLHLKCDISDAVFMLKKLSKALNLDYDEIQDIGYKRYDEALKNWRSQGRIRYFI
jgi:hypothetical protein